MPVWWACASTGEGVLVTAERQPQGDTGRGKATPNVTPAGAHLMLPVGQAAGTRSWLRRG